MSDLVIDARQDGDFGLVRLKGEARLEEADALRKSGRGLLTGGVKHLLIGVKELSFADSASIGTLMELGKDCAARGGTVVLHGCSKRFLKVLDAMGLSGRFKTAANEAAARKVV